MRIIKDITESEMVSVFLRAEIRSPRFKERYINQLRRDKKQISVIIRPNLESQTENRYREKLLGEARSYKTKGHDLFERFPNDVKWKRAYLSKGELLRVKYIDYSYWNELSSNSRLPKIAADNIRKGKTVYGHRNNQFWSIARKIKQRVDMPEIIIVAKDRKSPFVVLEGHARLTALMLVPEMIHKQTEVIIGFSKHIKDWGIY